MKYSAWARPWKVVLLGLLLSGLFVVFYTSASRMTSIEYAKASTQRQDLAVIAASH